MASADEALATLYGIPPPHVIPHLRKTVVRVVQANKKDARRGCARRLNVVDLAHCRAGRRQFRRSEPANERVSPRELVGGLSGSGGRAPSVCSAAPMPAESKALLRRRLYSRPTRHCACGSVVTLAFKVAPAAPSLSTPSTSNGRVITPLNAESARSSSPTCCITSRARSRSLS